MPLRRLKIWAWSLSWVRARVGQVDRVVQVVDREAHPTDVGVHVIEQARVALKQADDAQLLDTTALSIDEQVKIIVDCVRGEKG